MHKLRVFSPNQSCAPLRNLEFPNRILLRLGSTTPLNSKYKYLELNSIDGVRVSANKIYMKSVFADVNIHHSEWGHFTNPGDLRQFFAQHKIVIAKHRHSSKGENIYYIDNKKALEMFIDTHKNLPEFIFEKYYFYPNEYRLHVDVNHGCFYACKKILNDDALVQWHKHANNSTFVYVTPEHIKPDCWNQIVEDCQTVMKAMGLHIACFDILCSNDNFIIVESNTAPSLADYGLTFYSNHIQKYYGTRF